MHGVQPLELALLVAVPPYASEVATILSESVDRRRHLIRHPHDSVHCYRDTLHATECESSAIVNTDAYFLDQV
jgi:hypothetical protein